MANIRNINCVKIVIFPVLILILLSGCKGNSGLENMTAFRFDEWLKTWPADHLGDSIGEKHPELMTFYQVYNEQIIRIGPDSLSSYPEGLAAFLNDPVIISIYEQISLSRLAIREALEETQAALSEIGQVLPATVEPRMVTYVGGFNQSFVTLPGILAVGLEHYLGDTCSLYARLGMPAYLKQHKNPENIPSDALRAWIRSERGELPAGSTFLDHLVWEGIIYYLTEKTLSKKDPVNLFHFTREQLNWCRDQEKAMWKFLVQNDLLFSSDRFTIRRFFDEAPFTRDFGQDSPGRTGIWIGYRLVSSFAKHSNCRPDELLHLADSRKILAEAAYHP